jgi:hypothetical protein
MMTLRELKVCVIALVFLAFALGEASAQANEAEGEGPVKVVSSIELINESAVYDGKSVVYRGEVVGPVMVRGDYGWVNVYDGVYAIGVFCAKADCGKISSYGDYNHKGDVIEVSGVFHKTCLQHGGDLDIHASSLEVSEEGYLIHHAVGERKKQTAVALGLLALIAILTESLMMVIAAVKKWFDWRSWYEGKLL